LRPGSAGHSRAEPHFLPPRRFRLPRAAAISALVGLFTPEAALKLKQIFTTLLAPAPPGRDSLPPGTDPTADLSPPTS
jgi:hypothetical protein